MTRKEIEIYDKSDMFDVINNFAYQIKEAYDIGNSVDTDNIGRNFNKIVVAGMGGSAIGADLVRSYLLYELKIPLAVIRNYKLPSYIDENTLVILSSYSGGTEETLSVYKDAITNTRNIIIITTGGDLESQAAGYGFPIIKIPKGYQPRAAIAYSFFTLLVLIYKLDLISNKNKEIEDVIEFIKNRTAIYSKFDDDTENNALKIAKIIQGKIPVIYSSSDVLDAVNLRWRCQFEENSKTIGYGNYFPELNHNEIVGWQENPEILKKFALISLVDPNDHPRIKLRNSITLDMIYNMAGAAIELDGEGNTFLQRLMDLIHLGDWLSYYLAILNKLDPTTIDKINYLKRKLSES
jgi:glucose/mannose-6-phosphate isomerase